MIKGTKGEGLGVSVLEESKGSSGMMGAVLGVMGESYSSIRGV